MGSWGSNYQENLMFARLGHTAKASSQEMARVVEKPVVDLAPGLLTGP